MDGFEVASSVKLGGWDGRCGGCMRVCFWLGTHSQVVFATEGNTGNTEKHGGCRPGFALNLMFYLLVESVVFEQVFLRPWHCKTTQIGG